MTWHEAALSLQVISEERKGFVARYHAAAARAQEDAAWAAAVGAVSDEPR